MQRQRLVKPLRVQRRRAHGKVLPSDLDLELAICLLNKSQRYCIWMPGSTACRSLALMLWPVKSTSRLGMSTTAHAPGPLRASSERKKKKKKKERKKQSNVPSKPCPLIPPSLGPPACCRWRSSRGESAQAAASLRLCPPPAVISLAHCTSEAGHLPQTERVRPPGGGGGGEGGRGLITAAKTMNPGGCEASSEGEDKKTLAATKSLLSLISTTTHHSRACWRKAAENTSNSKC